MVDTEKLRRNVERLLSLLSPVLLLIDVLIRRDGEVEEVGDVEIVHGPFEREI